MKDSSKKTFLGFSIGLGLGALLSALFTPKSGKELRGDIIATKDKAQDKVGEAKDWTKDKVESARTKIKDKADNVREDIEK